MELRNTTAVTDDPRIELEMRETGLDNKGFADDGECEAGKQKSPERKDKEKSTEEDQKKKMQTTILSGLQYKVDDNPPWITTILLGFQHYLTLLSSNLATPGIMAGCICAIGIPNETHVKSELMGNMLFACGLCTLVQTFIGTRKASGLRSVDVYQISFVDTYEYSAYIFATKAPMNSTDEEPLYIQRMNELVGSIMVAAFMEILIGASGMVSVLLRFIGPLTVAPTIMLMGLAVAETGFELAGKHWGISAATVVLIILMSEIIPTFEFQNPFQRKRIEKIEFVVHKLFSVILSVCIMWLLCYILTVAGAFPEDSSTYGYEARTDIRLDVLTEASWIRFPYPGYWGRPTFSSAIFVAMIAGVITSVIESIGDYYTCARMAGALPPPPHAVNRGILIEGIDCILAVAFGAGFGVTSCSQNIGVISLTKVGSRRVALMGGAVMLVFGCLGKFSALAVSMPDPIIGASFLVLFGVLAAVGASNLQYVDLNSSRNLVVFGISLFLGLSFPAWVVKHAELIKTDNDSLDQVINALLANNMFMGCFSALVLDNVIPGSNEERGILLWREIPDQSDEDSGDDDYDNLNLSMKTYYLPFVTKYIRRWKYSKYIPFLPTFEGMNDVRCCCKGSGIDFTDTEVVYSARDDEMDNIGDNTEKPVKQNGEHAHIKMHFSDN